MTSDLEFTIDFSVINVVPEELRTKIFNECNYNDYNDYILYRSACLSTTDKIHKEPHFISKFCGVIDDNKNTLNVLKPDNFEKIIENYKIQRCRVYVLPIQNFNITTNIDYLSIFRDPKNAHINLTLIVPIKQNINQCVFEEYSNIEVDDIDSIVEKEILNDYNFEIKLNKNTNNSYILQIYNKKTGKQETYETLSSEDKKYFESCLTKYDYRKIYWYPKLNGFLIGKKMYKTACELFGIKN